MEKPQIIHRTFPQIRTASGIDPFYKIKQAQTLFDQSGMEEHYRVFPLRRFQETMLIYSALYRISLFQAPSQSGKTTGLLLDLILDAMAYPGDNVLLLSTEGDQAERLLRTVKEQFIDNCKIPEFRKLSKDSATILEFESTRSKIIALTHSIKAVTGNPARKIGLDEMAKWDEKSAHIIFAEAISRTGNTQGGVIGTSTFFGEGWEDSKSPKRYTGNFYNFKFKEERKQAKNPNKITACATFDYTVSPILKKQIEDPETRQALIRTMGQAAFDEHYRGIPRKSIGTPVYQHDFSRKDHSKSDSYARSLLNPAEPLFICHDPGLNKAAVIGQLDLDALRLIYLRAYITDDEFTLAQFVQKVHLKTRKEFPEYQFQYFADVAAGQKNRQTNETDLQVIADITGQWPYSEYQNIAPGIQVTRSFMRRRDAFIVSEGAPLLLDMFETGLVKDERGTSEIYIKDGYWEHLGDAARYPVYNITNGYTTDSLGIQGFGSPQPQLNPNTNPYTGY